jgi:hypothetical protein
MAVNISRVLKNHCLRVSLSGLSPAQLTLTKRSGRKDLKNNKPFLACYDKSKRAFREPTANYIAQRFSLKRVGDFHPADGFPNRL